MLTLNEWENLTAKERKMVWMIAVITSELSRPPFWEETVEAYCNCDPSEEKELEALNLVNSLVKSGFFKNSGGTVQVHPIVFDFMKNKNKKKPIDTTVYSLHWDKYEIESIGSFINFWFGDDITIIREKDDFSIINARAGDIIVSTRMVIADGNCFEIVFDEDRNAKLSDKVRHDASYFTKIVSHIRLFN